MLLALGYFEMQKKAQMQTYTRNKIASQARIKEEEIKMIAFFQFKQKIKFKIVFIFVNILDLKIGNQDHNLKNKSISRLQIQPHPITGELYLFLTVLLF